MLQRKRQSDVIVGLDLGSTAVRVVVGQVATDSVQLIGAVEGPSEGIHKGVVVSIEEVVSSISKVLEDAERLIGVPIDNVWLGISGTQTINQISKGVVAVAKTDGEISPDDVDRAIDAARMVAPPLNYEVLHMIPRSFSVDGQTGIKDPVGMTGIRLEVDTQIIYGLSSHVKNITKAVYRTGIDIHDVVVSMFALGDIVSTSRQRDRGVAVVDIGGSTSGMVVYENGEVIHSATLPIGGEHITNDIAIGLRTSIDVAERVKIEYGTCDMNIVKDTDVIHLGSVGGDTNDEVSKMYISEIIQARVSEILEKVDQELIRIGRHGLLPSGVIFTGGGAKIGGLVPIAKDVLGLPVTLGYALNIDSATEKANDIAFMGAAGLVKWGASSNSGDTPKKRVPVSSMKMFDAAQKLFKSLLP